MTNVEYFSLNYKKNDYLCPLEKFYYGRRNNFKKNNAFGQKSNNSYRRLCNRQNNFCYDVFEKHRKAFSRRKKFKKNAAKRTKFMQ